MFKRLLHTVPVALLIATMLLATPHSAFAASGPAPFVDTGYGVPATTITSYSVTCSSITISGNTAPGNLYVTIDVGTSNGNYAIYTTTPASGGHYSFSGTFPTATFILFIEAFGNTNSTPGFWDGRDLSSTPNSAFPCPASWSAGGAAQLSPLPPFTDGRLNKFAADDFQSVAVYCEKDAIVTYALYNSVGYFAFKVTAAQLAKFPEHPTKNTLIYQNLGVKLFKLTSGQYMVARNTSDGKVYTFTFDGCAKPA
jgi:hypothetical protein